MPSPALLAANERLLALRAERPTVTLGDFGEVARRKWVPNGSGAASHALRNAQVLLRKYRQRDGLDLTDKPVASKGGAQLSASPPSQQGGGRLSDEKHIRHYPSLGTAALKASQAPAYRLWLAARALDRQGRGWLQVQTLLAALSGEKAVLRLGGRRRLRQLLQAGEGRFWRRDGQGRLWLSGTARVAAALGVAKLSGRPVLLPLAALGGSIGDFKAQLYAAWHSGRRRAAPVSRAAQEALTGVSERSQRRYDRRAGVRARGNLAVAGRYSRQAHQEQAWRRGRGVFEFIDAGGRQGRPNGRYLAWRLPNSYHGPHRPAAKGRVRKINRKLKDLVNERVQGNGGGEVERRYYADGKLAGRAINRGAVGEVYWQMVGATGPGPEHRKNIWSVFLDV